MNDLIIILTGCLVAIPCSILGCFLVLRKMVMVGDAISHAVLPGIVVAFMITESFDSLYMIIGAALVGMLTTFLIEFFHRQGGLQQDASIGVTFTWLFAIGVILVSVFTRDTDLDQDCVLYGEIITVPFDLWITESGTNLGPSPIWTLGLVNLLIVAFVVLGFKELYITTFDSAFAASLGMAVAGWHYALMSSVSLVTVSSFESVGAILVISFLVAPAASAYLLTDRFKLMIVWAILFAISSSVIGYYAAVAINSTVSGTMASVAGLQALIVLVVSPKTKVLARLKKREVEPEPQNVQR